MNKYQQWYDQITARGKRRRDLRGYSEIHHILPRALGGGDEASNLVKLSYREHYLVHWLLIKIYDGEARRAMVYALHCMSLVVDGRRIAGWQIETAKRAIKDEVRRSAVARRARWRAKREQAVAEAASQLKQARAPSANLTIARDKRQVRDFANTLLLNRRRRFRRDVPKNFQSLYSSVPIKQSTINVSRGTEAFEHGKPRKRNKRIGPHQGLWQIFKS